MVESAWATARTRTRPGVRFRRLARRFGRGNEKKAAVAVAHTLICIAWAVLPLRPCRGLAARRTGPPPAAADLTGPA
jgi:hypothetical protein